MRIFFKGKTTTQNTTYGIVFSIEDGRGNRHICVAVYFCKKKHRKDKIETDKNGYYEEVERMVSEIRMGALCT